jgi:hypothetical protein
MQLLLAVIVALCLLLLVGLARIGLIVAAVAGVLVVYATLMLWYACRVLRGVSDV